MNNILTPSSDVLNALNYAFIKPAPIYEWIY